MTYTIQMLRDIVFFNNGPMRLDSLLKATKAVTPEQRAEIRALVKVASLSKTINFNPVENIVWVTQQQFKSCK